MNILNTKQLAIFGGFPVRSEPMPFRSAFGLDEEKKILEAVKYYRKNNIDPPYSGIFENNFCSDFVKYMGGGYADAVATGTAACYIAIAALELPKGSDILISPVTDSGPLNAIILLGFNPILIDSKKDSFNIDYKTFTDSITSKTVAAFLVHTAGEPIDLAPILKIAKSKNIKIIEDCSQSIGATYKDKRVGTYGDISAFSTMYRKNLASGGSGGIVYSKYKKYYLKALSYADRGRAKWIEEFDQRNPGDALFPALNFHTNEFSCAIGIASLKRLESTNKMRQKFLEELVYEFNKNQLKTKPYNFSKDFSPFYFPISIDEKLIKCSKIEFFKAIQKEGIDLSPEYDCVISNWKLAKNFIKNQKTKNAEAFRLKSANLFLNENYQSQEVKDIINAIKKVEDYFLL